MNGGHGVSGQAAPIFRPTGATPGQSPTQGHRYPCGRTRPPKLLPFLPGSLGLFPTKSDSKSPVFASVSWLLSSVPNYFLQDNRSCDTSCSMLRIAPSHVRPPAHRGTHPWAISGTFLVKSGVVGVGWRKLPSGVHPRGGLFSAPAHALLCRNIPPADSCPPRSQRLGAGRFLIAAFILPYPETQQKVLHAFSPRVP